MFKNCELNCIMCSDINNNDKIIQNCTVFVRKTHFLIMKP